MRFSITSSASKLSNWLLGIKESSCSGKWQEVLSHYNGLKKAGIQLTDHSFFHPILKACLILSFRHGKSIHASVIKQGFESFTSIGNSIMDFYVKSGALNSAMHVYDFMKSRDSVSWNIIICGNLDLGASEKGLWLFMRARATGFEPNISTLLFVIQAFRNLGAPYDGMKIHSYVIRSGFWTIASVQNSLLSMYVDIEMELAEKLFDEMSSRDVITWSVMIGGYVQNDESQIALGLFRDMVSDVGIEMDAQIMIIVLKACISLGNLGLGRLVHGFVICRGFDYDVFVGNSLVDMYSKFNDVDSGLEVFNGMPAKNDVSWNSLLSGFIQNEKHSEALMLFDSMRMEGIEADEVTLVNLLQICKYFEDPFLCKLIHSIIIRRGYELNELVINSLVDVYGKCNLITHAWKLFSQMKIRDTVTWGTMIAGFTRCGMPDKAIAVFQEMNQAREEPNVVIMLNLLDACSLSAELKRSKCAHGVAIIRDFASDVAVGTAILDMYSKCGAIEASRKAFDQIHQNNVVSWSAMIAAYGMNGFARDALALVDEMRLHGFKPNQVTALSVLSACSHGGLVEEGLSFFKQLVRDHEIHLTLEHYSCMVDLFGRAGKLDIAMDLIESMPKPGASAWGALLSACRNYGNSELGAQAVSHVIESDPSNSVGYLLASSMYAAGGAQVDAARMRWLVKESGLVRAGYSLVHVHNKAWL